MAATAVNRSAAREGPHSTKLQTLIQAVRQAPPPPVQARRFFGNFSCDLALVGRSRIILRSGSAIATLCNTIRVSAASTKGEATAILVVEFGGLAGWTSRCRATVRARSVRNRRRQASRAASPGGVPWRARLPDRAPERRRTSQQRCV